MPTWRVAEQLPAEMGAVELVIIDEASQSDVTELPALLRGKKILVVGDAAESDVTRRWLGEQGRRGLMILCDVLPERYGALEVACEP
jgi:hypothetical protein